MRFRHNGYMRPTPQPSMIDVRMALSPHFRLSEFTKSRTAERHQLFNIPREEAEVANLRALARSVLEPIRALFSKYVVIRSGYRSGALNRLVGGEPTSQHLFGEAADFVVRGVHCFEAASAISGTEQIPFDQLIYEVRPSASRVSDWLHVSHRRLGSNRREVLTIIKDEAGRRVLSGVCPYLSEVGGPDRVA